MRIIKSFSAALLLFMALLLVNQNNADACSRLVYVGPNNTIVTARSMDWAFDIMTNLWIFPAGMDRNGAIGSNTVSWKSKYGSVVASAYEICSSDGMNEKGLVASVLWLSESEYPVRTSKPGLSVAAWVQYVLDNYATVDETVTELSKENFEVVGLNVPGTDIYGTLHLVVSDATGDNAIFEYVKGKLIIHHDRSYIVTTNSPLYEKQLALNEYWSSINGLDMLPGTHKSEDRFVRASFYLNAIKKTDDIRQALTSTFGVIRNVSVPFGISTTDKPNLSSTRWRTVYDHKNKVFYFEKANCPSVIWVDFKEADISPKGQVKKLTLVNDEIYTGNVLKDFVVTEPFKFAGTK
ncbi:MAG: linear amide C-N hydrolase [Ignavibacteria bacterium]|nr:linear amide C-N hydrolase [Ignavibacteria bacterium]